MGLPSSTVIFPKFSLYTPYASSAMQTRVLGSVMDLRFVPAKAIPSISSTHGKVIVSRDMQDEKQAYPIRVNEFGNMTVVRLRQLLKDPPVSSITPLGIVMEERF